MNYKYAAWLAKQSAVAVVAVLLTFTLAGVIALWLVPNLADVALYNYNPALRPNLIGHEREVRNALLLVRYGAEPLAGFLVGVFIGLCQRSKPLLLAVICWLPVVARDVKSGSFFKLPWLATARYLSSRLPTILCCIVAVLLVNVVWKHFKVRAEIVGA